MISARRPSPSEILPGDWLHIGHEGKEVVGMIYAVQGDVYTFVYWDNQVLHFGTAVYAQIGSRDEHLTELFRGQIAIDPHYIVHTFGRWLPNLELPAMPARIVAEPSREPHWIQKWLFPEMETD